MKLYNVFYKDYFDGTKEYECTTDNFEKWLEEHNKTKLQENDNDADFIDDADDFEVEEINPILYEEITQ